MNTDLVIFVEATWNASDMPDLRDSKHRRVYYVFSPSRLASGRY